MIIAASDTRSRILDIAEELFGEHGLERVSIRDITAAAEVNVAAVNYHFGSKEKLIEAVFERRFGPMNEQRLVALDAVQAAPGKPTTEQLVEALIRPALACCFQRGGGFAKLLGRCLAESGPELEAFLMKQFEPVAQRFEAAFIRALPHLTPEDVYWRMKFTFGAMHHWLLTRGKFLPPSALHTSVEAQTEMFIQFCAAGFRSGNQREKTKAADNRSPICNNPAA